jgi:hypothetical protein
VKKTPQQRKKPLSNNAKYTTQEIMMLLEIVEKHVPMDGADWDVITEEFNTSYPRLARQKRNLRTKFLELAGKRVPTGDPNCPIEVKTVKRILELIKNKAHMYDTNGLQDEVLPTDISLVFRSTNDKDDKDDEETKESVQPIGRLLPMKPKRQIQNDNSEFIKMFLIQDEKNRMDVLHREERSEQRQRDFMALQQEQNLRREERS